MDQYIEDGAKLKQTILAFVTVSAHPAAFQASSRVDLRCSKLACCQM
jgi:hypothetical protein